MASENDASTTIFRPAARSDETARPTFDFIELRLILGRVLKNRRSLRFLPDF
jgi:hypothetical protein